MNRIEGSTIPMFAEPSPAIPAATAAEPSTRVRQLGQYMTPFWLAEAIVERHFSDLAPDTVFIEPTCGTGAFLRALPAHVRAHGIEIDPALAARARVLSGRQVITGDFREHLRGARADAMVGNPPFEADLIDALLTLSLDTLRADGRLGLVLPAYVFQTAGRVVRYSRDWSIFVEMIPRNVFPGLQCPLSFAIFRKDRLGHMVGLSFYEEAEEVLGMPKHVSEQLRESAGVWATVVEEALIDLGGEASLDQLYARIQPRRPTPNQHWKASVRKVIRERQDRIQPVGRARYRHLAAAA